MNSYVSALFKLSGTSISSCGTFVNVAGKLAELTLRVDDEEEREEQDELGRAKQDIFLFLLIDGPSRLVRSKNSATSLEMRVVAAAMLVFDEAKAEADVY